MIRVAEESTDPVERFSTILSRKTGLPMELG